MKINVDDYSQWVGKTLEINDELSLSPLNRMSATLDKKFKEFTNGDEVPPLWHWLYFLESTPQSMLAEDGHAKRGGFLPPIPLPRRMWAGSRFNFKAPLKAGEKVSRTSRIKDIKIKEGKTGSLAFVNVSHEIKTKTGVALMEEHDIVYRENPKTKATSFSAKQPEIKSDFSESFTPDPVVLFRYSALTFNGHRIHYDRDYVTEVEGYPGLLVHGPLLATLMLDCFIKHHPGLKISNFEFKAHHPVFDLKPFKICGQNPNGDNQAELWVQDIEKNLCMRACVTVE